MQCTLCSSESDYPVDLNKNKVVMKFCLEKVLDSYHSHIDDKILSIVCLDCFNKLKEFHEFVEHCNQSYEVAQSRANQHRKEKENLQDDNSISKDITLTETGNMELKVMLRSKSKLCPFCGKQWPSQWKLLQHINSHTGEQPYKCSHCDRLLTTKYSLKQHERTHFNIKPHRCKYCEKSFGQSNELATHLKLHTGKDVICEICGTGFCRKSELRIHMRKHTGEKPYECKECGKCFPVAGRLREHSATHSSDRAFVCERCGASFKRKSTLTKHELIHADAFTYKCALCDYGSHKQWNLGQHIKKHHG